jgi:predicted permease
MRFRRRTDRDFEEELKAHLNLEAERRIAEGVPEDEARRLACRDFGSATAARERYYESRHNIFFDNLLRDARYALRTLARSPGYAAAAILTLALGIGANTAIFSATDEILLRPPDVPESNRLAQVYSFNRKTSTYRSSSYPDYLDFRRQARSFENLAAYARFSLNVQIGGEVSDRISVEAVTGNYFSMLRVAPLGGRALEPADDMPGAAPMAMIAEDLWRTRLQADPAAIGKPIAISGRQFTVVGIVPRRVGGLNLNWATPPRIWIPLRASALVIPRFDKVFDSRGAIWLVLAGRLNRGVSMSAAQAEMQAIAANIGGNRDVSAMVYPLSRSKFWPAYRNDIQTSLTGFGIASGLILLLACANVSNLLLGRALARRRELAMRLAIGAGRRRIVQQLLTEAAVLGALSCGAGILVADGLMRLLRQFPAALGLTLNLDLQIESRALAFCIVLSACVIALFGLAPAFQTAKLAVMPSLKSSGSSAADDRREWFRWVLVAVQAAFAMVLLIGGGLYGRTLWKAYSTDLGFRSDHLLTAAFSLPPPGRESADQMWRAQRGLLARLAATPGVVAATLSSTGILSPGYPQVRIETGPDSAPVSAACEYVSRDFLRTMGIRLFAGEDFSARGDEAGAVAIVNRTLARSLAPGSDPIGKTILVETAAQTKSRFMIVGVAGDTRYGSIWQQPEPHVYLPAGQADVSAGFLAVRTSVPPQELAEPLRKLWSDLAPMTPLYEIQTARERVNLALTPQGVAAAILGGFALLALILTAIGLYSVVAFSVARQKREIGIRIAIGASPRAIFTAVLRKSMIPAVAGLAAGITASVPLMRVLAVKARNVSPYDEPTYLAVALVLAAVACAAAMAPAYRAMRVDPATVLRSE